MWTAELPNKKDTKVITDDLLALKSWIPTEKNNK